MKTQFFYRIKEHTLLIQELHIISQFYSLKAKSNAKLSQKLSENAVYFINTSGAYDSTYCKCFLLVLQHNAKCDNQTRVIQSVWSVKR